MKVIGLFAAFVLLAGAAGGATGAQAQDKASHIHIAHVLDAWNDTPDGMGLLPTAKAEAAIALQHVALALESTDLKGIQLHIGHVMHALNPEIEANGPGLGYGVVKAAQGVVAHIGFSAGSDDASDNVKTHSVHVSASAGNVVTWAEAALKFARTAKSTTYSNTAKFNAVKIQKLLTQIVDGVDANEDGTVGWQEGEGGLAQAEQHMGFMTSGEGLT